MEQEHANVFFSRSIVVGIVCRYVGSIGITLFSLCVVMFFQAAKKIISLRSCVAVPLEGLQRSLKDQSLQ